jgi:hypothetical protein
MNLKKIILISKVSLFVLTFSFVSAAYASEVTGSLSSAGVTSGGSSVVTGTFGGGTSIVSGTVTGGNFSGGGGGGNFIAATLPSGSVLGVATENAPVSTGDINDGTALQVGGGDLATATTITPLSAPVVSNNLNTNQLAAVDTSGISLGAWYWWVIILLLLVVLGYYQYRRYENNQNKRRRVSIK